MADQEASSQRGIPYPYRDPVAAEFFEVLIAQITNTREIELLYKKSGGLEPLNWNSARPRHIWMAVLETLSVAGLIPVLCNQIMAGPNLPGPAAAARRLILGWPPRSTVEQQQGRSRIPMMRGKDLQLVADAMVSSYDLDALARDLRYKLDRRLDAITDRGTLPDVSFQVLDTAEREGWLEDQLNMFSRVTYPDVREVAKRVPAQYSADVADAAALRPASDRRPGSPTETQAFTPAETQGLADPFLTFVVGQQPFVDRKDLRLHLKDLLSTSKSRVLAINGDRPCGKTHTWFYLRQPELLGDTIAVLIDLSETEDPVSPTDVISSIALQLGLPQPTVDPYAQGAAQVARLRDWLVGQLQSHDRAGSRWLVVFDSLDHPAQRDDTMQLIEFLAGAAIWNRISGLRVILLGYSNRIPIDPLDSVLTETVYDIGESEVRDFYRALALHEGVSISDEAIDIATQSVLSLLPTERAIRLKQLPKMVRLVGNTAFGRKVLP